MTFHKNPLKYHSLRKIETYMKTLSGSVDSSHDPEDRVRP